jgi:hypothetical protein
MAHVFISYVRADADKVHRLALDFYQRGIDTWTDRDLRPGQHWKMTIRRAIQDGVAFLPCFSSEVLARDRTYMYEEIATSIEILRQIPTDRTWFIPVRLELCALPPIDISAGLTLRDLQWVDLFPDWDSGVAALASAIQQALTYEAPPPGPDEPRLPPLRDRPEPRVVEAWRAVWTTLFQLQVAGQTLLSRVEEDNLRRYAGLLDESIRIIGESAFYLR